MLQKIKKHPIIFVTAAIVVAVLAALISTGTLHRYIQETIYDNVPSGVSCADLPSRAEVDAVLARKADLVKKIKDTGENPTDVSVSPGSTCIGRAEIHIMYGGRQTRLKIQEILRHEDFDGVPVSFQNI